ncbi:hypothetical protein GCM10011332_04570 [Terasakiella brassicae]|uniref:Uncharacterized protein n=1 Tax=Terasakiella brassicae TaxID=1634917 RepID=A0A917BTV2_9PROT|nr:hypothetical protein [Terasakiella brassicae]GGF54246.1 hypothetical protein GCM10011332_04570 [Terasakiella brassicae]
MIFRKYFFIVLLIASAFINLNVYAQEKGASVKPDTASIDKRNNLTFINRLLDRIDYQQNNSSQELLRLMEKTVNFRYKTCRQ